MNVIRFSAAQVGFHMQPMGEPLKIDNEQQVRIWKELDQLGDLVQKPEFDNQIQALSHRVRIDFYPHTITSGATDASNKNYPIGTEVAWISTVDDAGNEQAEPKANYVERGLSWLWMFNGRESMRSFLEKVLTTARVASRAIQTQP